MSNLTYVKKITSSLGWLRRLDAKDPATDTVIKCEPQPLMRIRAMLTEGWQEAGDKGEYIRWVGKIGAEVVNRGGNGVSHYISRNMILPQVAEDFIVQQFKQSVKETTLKGRTGTYFSLPDDFGECSFVIDLYLKQPSNPAKPSATGYEFDMRIVEAERMENPVATLGVDLPPLVPSLASEDVQRALPLDPAIPVADPEPAPVAVADPEPAPDDNVNHEHAKGKGKHKAT